MGASDESEDAWWAGEGWFGGVGEWVAAADEYEWGEPGCGWGSRWGRTTTRAGGKEWRRGERGGAREEKGLTEE